MADLLDVLASPTANALGVSAKAINAPATESAYLIALSNIVVSRLHACWNLPATYYCRSGKPTSVTGCLGSRELFGGRWTHHSRRPARSGHSTSRNAFRIAVVRMTFDEP